MPFGTEKALLQGSGVTVENYFGDGSDGDVTISGNTELTVLNKVGDFDGDMVVMNYNSLTINASMTLDTNFPSRGMLLYIMEDLTVSGTLSMSRRGCYVNPESSGGSDSAVVNVDGLQLPMFTTGGSDTLGAATFAGAGNAAVAAVANQDGISGDGTIFSIARQGQAGCAGTSTTGPTCADVVVSDGKTGQTAGGGGGAGDSGTGGNGSYGSCFSGGSGSGGGAGGTGGNGTIWSGEGGGGTGSNNSTNNACGGAGNPGGGPNTTCVNSGNVRSDVYPDDTAGTAGIIWLIVGGDVLINSGGSILSSGTAGGEVHTHFGTCGGGNGGRKAASGGSGGGCIMILHAGSYTNNGTVVAGGGGGCGPSNLAPRVYGGSAGDGALVVAQVK